MKDSGMTIEEERLEAHVLSKAKRSVKVSAQREAEGTIGASMPEKGVDVTVESSVRLPVARLNVATAQPLRGGPERGRVVLTGREVPRITPITLPATVGDKAFSVRAKLTPEITVVREAEEGVRQVALRERMTLERWKVPLEPVGITVPRPEETLSEWGIRGGELKALEAVPYFYDAFLEGGFRNVVTTDRPVCIIIPGPPFDSYVASIAIICRELYRVRKGGKPSPRIVSAKSEDVERSLEAERRIFVIDDPEGKLINLGRIKVGGGRDEINWELLKNRLRELFSQDYGFVIFHISWEWAEALRDKLQKEVIPKVPNLIMIKPRMLSFEVKREIAEISWGFVKTEGLTFDELFSNAEKAFYDKLEEISKNPWLMHCVKPHGAGPESHEHRLLKTFVVKSIAKEGGIRPELIPERILTEHEIGGGFVADIYVKDTEEYIEVETLYGAGFNPTDKIRETLEKYVNRGIARVKIVVMPLTLLTYIKNLITIKEFYRAHHGVDVEFYTVDVENEKLVSLEEVVEKLRKLKRRVEVEIEGEIEEMGEEPGA